MSDDRTEELIDAYLQAETDPQGSAELAELLRADPSARRRLVERALLEVHLYRACSDEADLGPVPLPAVAEARPRARRLRMGGLAAAAGLLLAVGLAAAWYLWRPQARPGDHEVVSGVVSVGGVRSGASAVVADGATVKAVGQWPARLRLADGSRVELQPASEAAFHAGDGDQRLIANLLAGTGRFDVPPGRGLFRVRTPLGSVTVLGTQFTVRLGRGEDRSLTVAVDRGKVAVRFDARDYQLAAGQSRIFTRRRQAVASGVLGGVDPGRKTVILSRIIESTPGAVVLSPEGDSRGKRACELAGDVSVAIDGRPADLAALRSGMSVRLTFGADGKTVIRVEASGPTLSGVVTAVDAAARTLTITTGRESRKQRTLAVSPSAQVLLRGRKAALSDIAPGSRPTLRLATDGRTIIEIRLGGQGEDREGRR